MNTAIISKLETAVMNSAVVARTVALIRERLSASGMMSAESRSGLAAEAKSVEDRIGRLVSFVETAEHIDSGAIARQLRELEAKRATIEKQMADCEIRQRMPLDAELAGKIAARFREWRTILRGNVAVTRVLLTKLLAGPIVMTPSLPGTYAFEGRIRLDEVLAIGGAVSVASPTGTADGWPLKVEGVSDLDHTRVSA
ncbi:MAG: hypothetical protein ACKOEC_20700 [Acidimicrobiia bacterium]